MGQRHKSAPKMVKTINAHTESTNMIFKTFKKINLMTQYLEAEQSTALWSLDQATDMLVVTTWLCLRLRPPFYLSIYRKPQMIL
jgi:hypothetical protein